MVPEKQRDNREAVPMNQPAYLTDAKNRLLNSNVKKSRQTYHDLSTCKRTLSSPIILPS